MSVPYLSDAVAEYLDSRKARNIAKNTVANERVVLNQLLAATGNLLVKNLTGRHIDMYFTSKPGLSPGTWNRNVGYLQGFFKWCRARKYVPRDFDPLEGINSRKVPPRDFIFLPQDRFSDLLAAASTPRDRALIAIGLYSFQRASEITRLTWEDIEDSDPNPKLWQIAVYRQKTSERDWLPLPLELREELQRWRLEYGRIMGTPPLPHWYVTPAFERGEWGQHPSTRKLVRLSPLKLNPTARFSNPAKAVHAALEGIGYDSTEREGCHTLRRSGGLALYNELAWNRGHDGALRIVQSMYGHKSLATTERYLRLTLERKRRNDLLSGQAMFTNQGGAVVNLSGEAATG